MAAQLIDGKKLAQEIKDQLRQEIAGSGIKPRLAVGLVGENPASKLYVSNKQKACKEVGVGCEIFELPAEVSEKELTDLIQKLNNDQNFHGIMVQLPLPEQINERAVLDSINPGKDVDGLTTANLGKVLAGKDGFVPATPAGVMHMLEAVGVDPKGKNVVIIGHSNIVGKPLEMLLVNKLATVTICHIETQNLSEHTQKADILISAVGKAGLITGDMIKEGAVVIDIGISKIGDTIVGDVDFEAVKEKASYITPVPGGVGPMTIAMLLKNTVRAAKA